MAAWPEIRAGSCPLYHHQGGIAQHPQDGDGHRAFGGDGESVQADCREDRLTPPGTRPAPHRGACASALQYQPFDHLRTSGR
jgi:hypothetical protein